MTCSEQHDQLAWNENILNSTGPTFLSHAVRLYQRGAVINNTAGARTSSNDDRLLVADSRWFIPTYDPVHTALFQTTQCVYWFTLASLDWKELLAVSLSFGPHALIHCFPDLDLAVALPYDPAVVHTALSRPPSVSVDVLVVTRPHWTGKNCWLSHEWTVIWSAVTPFRTSTLPMMSVFLTLYTLRCSRHNVYCAGARQAVIASYITNLIVTHTRPITGCMDVVKARCVHLCRVAGSDSYTTHHWLHSWADGFLHGPTDNVTRLTRITRLLVWQKKWGSRMY